MSLSCLTTFGLIWTFSSTGISFSLVFELYTSQAFFRPADFIGEANVTHRNNLFNLKDGANASFSLTAFRPWWN
jgi:hypothetical protein